MTNVKIFKDKSNILGFEISGHSGYAEEGRDIVCSAISTLSQSICVGIDNVLNLSAEDQFEFLVSLKGVGEKVANCVMLFGLGVMNSFPVDTWINKVYNKLTNTISTDRKKITKELSARYGNFSGYAQQYFFYYFRENKIS